MHQTPGLHGMTPQIQETHQAGSEQGEKKSLRGDGRAKEDIQKTGAPGDQVKKSSMQRTAETRLWEGRVHKGDTECESVGESWERV